MLDGNWSYRNDSGNSIGQLSQQDSGSYAWIDDDSVSSYFSV